MKNLILLLLLITLTNCAAYYRLINAIEDNDMEIFSELIDREDVKVNHQVMSGETLLHTAVKYDRLEMVDSLLGRGANPFALNAKVESPFLLMLWNMKPDMVKLIKKYGLDVGILNQKKQNMYFLVIDKFHEELEARKENLIKYNVLGEEFKNQLDTTVALRYDLKIDSLQMRMNFSFKKLINLGVNINGTDTEKNTPLLYAAKKNELSLIAFLNSIITGNSKIEIKNIPIGAMECLTPAVFTSLSKALHENNLDIGQNDIDGNNSLLHSALVSKTLVQILTMLGSDPYVKNFAGQSIAFKSVQGGHFNLVNYSLEDLGIGINEVDNSGNNLLQYFAINSEATTTTALKLIDPIFNIGSHKTPGRNKEHLEIANYLLKARIDINTINKNGESPLILSLKNNNQNLAVEILKYHPDVNIKDNEGKRAIDYATDNKYDDIILTINKESNQ